MRGIQESFLNFRKIPNIHFKGNCRKSLIDDIKIARQMRFSTAGYVCSNQTRVNFNPVVLLLY